MREILFRGKRTDNKQWVEGFYALIGEENPNTYIIKNNGHKVRVAHKSISEYTDLTDKNGTKIFEGDICKHRSNYSGNLIISVVTYIDGGFLALADNDSGFGLSGRLEVIGNIHDNPELLRKEEKR